MTTTVIPTTAKTNPAGTKPYFDSQSPDHQGQLVLVELGGSVPKDLQSAIEGSTGDDLTKPPPQVWLLEMFQPVRFEQWIPEPWLQVAHPKGGCPRNVWAGLFIEFEDDLLKLPELLACRTRRHYVRLDEGLVLSDEGRQLFEIYLGAWRCSSCGMRGMGDVPRCAKTMLCDRNTLRPQIDWVIDPGSVYGNKDFLYQKGIIQWPIRPER
jgi:hypothetical protein